MGERSRRSYHCSRLEERSDLRLIDDSDVSDDCCEVRSVGKRSCWSVDLTDVRSFQERRNCHKNSTVTNTEVSSDGGDAEDYLKAAVLFLAEGFGCCGASNEIAIQTCCLVSWLQQITPIRLTALLL